MKILVISQYYYPEPFRISDICEEMVNNGHEVQVITGYPNYPEGKVYKGYGKGKKINEIINGVRIHRCFTIPRKSGIFYRFLNYYSFAIVSSLNVIFNRIKSSDNKKFDIIFVYQLSPVMMAYSGILYKKKYNKKLILYCLDLWPESLVAGGIKKNSIIYNFFNKISKNIYKNCDQILVTSKQFIKYFHKEFQINKNKIVYLPQYAESLFSQIKKKQQVNNQINLVFAGNIGEAQDLKTIVEAANILKNEKNIFFHIVGSGTSLNYIKNMVKNKGITNIKFYGRKPLEEMYFYYDIADAMLITLSSDPILSFTLPGKVQSYMAAGRPIIGAINGEAQFVIRDSKCGYVCNSGDSKMLAKNIKKFACLEYNERVLLGDNAKKYYNKYFSKEIFMKNISKYFN